MLPFRAEDSHPVPPPRASLPEGLIDDDPLPNCWSELVTRLEALHLGKTLAATRSAR